MLLLQVYLKTKLYWKLDRKKTTKYTQTTTLLNLAIKGLLAILATNTPGNATKKCNVDALLMLC